MAEGRNSRKVGKQPRCSGHRGPRVARDGKGRLLILGVVVCGAIAGLFVARQFWRADKGSQQEGEPQTERTPLGGLRVSPREPAIRPTPPDTVIPEPEAVPPEPTPLPPKQATTSAEPAYVPPATVKALREEEFQVARRLMDAFPDSPDAMIVMGNAYSNRGNSAEAEKYWEKCLQLEPNHADVYDSMAWLANRKGEFPRAVALWRKALKIAPEMSILHARLALVLMRLGEVQEAVAVLNTSIEISPRDGSSYYLLGRAYSQLNDYQRAKQSYEAAIAIDPDYTSAYYGLATVCTKLGQPDRAKKCMKEFRRLKAQNLGADKDLRRGDVDRLAVSRHVSRTYTDAGRIHASHGDPREAEDCWRKAAVLDPKNIKCRMAMSALYERTGRNREALHVCEELRALDPGNARHHLNIGVLCARLDRFHAAEAALKKAAELAPKEAAAYRELAQLYLRAGRSLAEAVKLAERAVQLRPSAPNYFVQGGAYAKTGDRERALSSLERAVSLDPDNEHYRRTLQLLRKRE